MEAYGAVSTYELLAGITVNLECIIWVPKAVEHLLEAGGFFLDLREANNLSIPPRVGGFQCISYQVTAKRGGGD